MTEKGLLLLGQAHPSPTGEKSRAAARSPGLSASASQDYPPLPSKASGLADGSRADGRSKNRLFHVIPLSQTLMP